MTDQPSNALLPPGMNDILPPDAAFETQTVESLLSVFRAWGYEQVKPPLLEFEDRLLGGAGAAMTQQTFRLGQVLRVRVVKVDTVLRRLDLERVTAAGRARPSAKRSSRPRRADRERPAPHRRRRRHR